MMMNLCATFVNCYRYVTTDHSNCQKPHSVQRVTCRLCKKADWIPLSFQSTIFQALKVIHTLPLILMSKYRLVTTGIQTDLRNW